MARTHLIGLLLGTEEDWSEAFETLVARTGAIEHGGDAARAGHRARDDRAVRPARAAAPRARHRPARPLVLRPARVDQEGRADGRRVPPEQPVHVPGDGEALGLLRDDPARAEGARDVARPAQAAARRRALRLHRRALQPAVRPRRRRGAGRLPAVHEAVRRWRLGRREPGPRPRAARRSLRRVRRAPDAPPGRGRRLRRLRAQPVDRRRDDGHALRARPPAPRPLPGRPRLPRAGDRPRGGDDRPHGQRVLPLGVQQLRDADPRRRGPPDRLRQRLPGRQPDQPPLLLPLGDQGARALVRLLHA